MATEESFEFGTDSRVTVGKAETVALPPRPMHPSSAAEPKGLDRIIEMITDPEVVLADVMRLIALEMALVMKLMTHDDPISRTGYTQRDLNDRMKSFQLLQKTLTDSDQLSKRDTLNLEGPKFKFVFMELIRLFKQALKDSGLEKGLSDNIMLQWGDLVKSNDESLRRELSKI